MTLDDLNSNPYTRIQFDAFHYRPTNTIFVLWSGLPKIQIVDLLRYIDINKLDTKEINLVIIDDWEGEYISKIIDCGPAVMMFPYFVDNFKEVSLISSSYYPENQLAALKKYLPCISKIKSIGTLRYCMLARAIFNDELDQINKSRRAGFSLINNAKCYDKHFISLNSVPRLYRAFLLDNILSSDIKDTLYYSWVLKGQANTDINILVGWEFITFDPNKRVLLDLNQDNIDEWYDNVPDEYNRAVIDLFIETSCDAEYTNDVFITEKTWKPILKEKIFLGFHTPNYYKELVNDGFRLYYNLFDYSFDSILDNDERFKKYMENVYRIGRMPLNDVIKLAESHDADIKYNRRVALQKKDEIPKILEPHIGKFQDMNRIYSITVPHKKERIQMGNLYRKTNDKKWTTYLTDTQCIVEIGSDNYEGSTEFYAELANTHNIPFYTVDLNPNIEPRLRTKQIDEFWKNTSFILSDGNTWAKSFNGPQIHTLYLDNFDWDWMSPDESDESNRYYNDVLIPQYEEIGFKLNNINSAVEHLKQMLSLLPYMATDCVVCIDDTYLSQFGLYSGKGAGVVPYLLAIGFIIADNNNTGVILVRGKYAELITSN